MKIFLTLFLFFLFPIFGFANNAPFTQHKVDSRALYKDMHLKDKVSYKAFAQAMAGYNKLHPEKKDILTLIDFSKPSTEERFFVFDIKNKKILKSSVVSHGKNSGNNYATSFSNKNGSNKSSLGFYITENTYQGHNGYSLVLDGLEDGINDNAKERTIVIHGAAYADPSIISIAGRLGRSLGCPALPKSMNKQIIDTIKDGSLLYIYANDPNYVKQSDVIPHRTANA